MPIAGPRAAGCGDAVIATRDKGTETDSRSTGMSRVSACLVTFAPVPELPACLAALAAQSRPLHEVIVVDNGGDPAVLATVRAAPVVTRLICNGANEGFAAAMNRAIDAAAGDVIFTVNPDAIPAADFVERALARLAAEPRVGAVAGRLLRMDGESGGEARLDSAGVRLGFLRRPKDRGAGLPAAGRFLAEEDVDSACAALALFRRAALEVVRDARGGCFDARFFAYREDVDLCWRLRRHGWRILYVPPATGLHRRGWRERSRRSVPAALRRHSLKNRLLMIARNESVPSLLLRLPALVAHEIGTFLFALAREPEIVPAWPLALRLLPSVLRERRAERRRESP